MEPTVEFIVDEIFPTQEVHLFVGPSGAGKTTYLFQFSGDWADGKPIFGHKSYPLPYVYISCDRSLRSVKRTLKRMGITREIPMFSPVDRGGMNIDQLFYAVEKEFPTARVLFIEGLATKVPGGNTNDYHAVFNFVTRLARICQEKDWTIVGVGHSTKTKENEKYLNPRERALGSVAWAAGTETVVLFEPVKPEDISQAKLRNVWLLPRNAPEEMIEMEFSGGILVPVTRKIEAVSPLEQYVFALSAGESFTADEARGAVGISSSSFYRKIADLERRGLVHRIRSGHYCFTPGNSDFARSLGQQGKKVIC